ncbi:MAG: hypothetical protein ACYTFA_01840 [Planctomycetota bacterium]
MRTLQIMTCVTVLAIGSGANEAWAQSPLSTAIAYQGQLKLGGVPVTGEADFEFRLWDEAGSGDPPTGGNPAGPTLTFDGQGGNPAPIAVVNGMFTVQLDFGDGTFNGDARWLEIVVTYPSGSGVPTALSPRQPITPAPYALALPGLWPQHNATSPNLIGGYNGNAVTANVAGATISGGGQSGLTNRVTDEGGTIGGGRDNQAGDDAGTTIDALDATVAGGSGNTASGLQSTVSGGRNNTASGQYSAVGGGYLNSASDDGSTVSGGSKNSASGELATIAGGYKNTASGDMSAVGGGEQNSVKGNHATVPGGSYNQAWGVFSLAAGQRAQANHGGSFVWSDSTTESPDVFASTNKNQFLVKALGGVGINTNAPGAALHIGGTAGADGLMFPDGTLQTTAAVGGGGDSLWSESGSDIFYTAGDVGVGTSSPAHPLHVHAGTSTAIHAEVAATSGLARGVDAIVHSINGKGVYGRAQASSGSTAGVLGGSQSPDGVGVDGYNDASEGDAIGIRGITSSPTGFGGYFEGRGYFSNNVGIGTDSPAPGSMLHVIHPSSIAVVGECSGEGTRGYLGTEFGGVVGEADLAGGFGGYFDGRGYFSGNVGIGNDSPDSKLHIVGPNDPTAGPILTLEADTADSAESGRIRFGESTGNLRGAFLHYDGFANELHIGTHNAATSDPADDVNMITLERSTGRVGVHTSVPQQPFHVAGSTYMEGSVGIRTIPSEDLHVAGDSRFDGNVGIGTAPGTLAPLQVVSNTLAGIKSSTSLTLGGAGVWGDASSDTGETFGVYGTALSPDGAGVRGESAGIGVEGIGGTYGLRGEADGSVEFSFGVAGRASTVGGRGVTAYNSATEGDPIAIWGGTGSPGGFGGFFLGNGYFSRALTIGGTWEPSNQLTVRDDPFSTLDPGMELEIQDHVALIENEHPLGETDEAGVLALRAKYYIGRGPGVGFITFYRQSPDIPWAPEVGSIRGNNVGGVTLISMGSDYAEWLPTVDREESFDAGDVVGVVGGRITKNTAGAHHVMVISTGPIVAGNQPPDRSDEHNGYEMAAFIGQVPVKVRGPVAEGDFIIPSGLQDGTGVGVSPEAVTSEQFAQVIGQAWESCDEPGLNRVRAVVGQLPHDPTVARMATRIRELKEETATLRGRLESLEATVARLAFGGNRGE